MDEVKAILVVAERTEQEHGGHEVQLRVATNTDAKQDEEIKQYFAATPGGQLTLCTLNTAAFDFLKPGMVCDVTIKERPPSSAAVPQAQ